VILVDTIAYDEAMHLTQKLLTEGDNQAGEHLRQDCIGRRNTRLILLSHDLRLISR